MLPPLHDYDDGDDDGLTDLPSGVSLSGYGSGGLDGGSNGMSGSMKAGEKQIRRRSSKACDQCRKSKCKCERSAPSEPCKNCVLLGTRTCFSFVRPSPLSVVRRAFLRLSLVPLLRSPFPLIGADAVIQLAPSLGPRGNVVRQRATSTPLRLDFTRQKR